MRRDQVKSQIKDGTEVRSDVMAYLATMTMCDVVPLQNNKGNGLYRCEYVR